MSVLDAMPTYTRNLICLVGVIAGHSITWVRKWVPNGTTCEALNDELVRCLVGRAPVEKREERLNAVRVSRTTTSWVASA